MHGSLPHLCAICGLDADHQSPIPFIAELADAVPAGELLIQIRAKHLPARDLLRLAQQLIHVARPQRHQVIVNDRLDVALAAGADGVHLPRDGLAVYTARRLANRSDFLIGASASDGDGAGAAARDGADFIIVAPVWRPSSKNPAGGSLGPDGLAAAVSAVQDVREVPVYAAGGVTGAAEASAAKEAGAYGIAIAQAFADSRDPASIALDALSPWTQP